MHFKRVLMATLLMLSGNVSADCLQYDKKGTVLEGALMRLEYKARNPEGKRVPGTIWQVRRVVPFCVAGDDRNLHIEGASSVELAIDPMLEKELLALDGERVRLEGRFVPTGLPHFHPELIFAPSKVEKIKLED